MWMAQAWSSAGEALKLLQQLLLNRFIFPAKYQQIGGYKQVNALDSYIFQEVGKGKTFVDISRVDWEELGGCLGKGVKVKDRWKGMKKTSNCFLGNELVDMICQKFQIIRPVGVSMGEEMMSRGYFFPVEVGVFLDKPVFYTVVQQKSDPSQQKLVQTLQRVMKGDRLDSEMKENVSFMLRMLVQQNNSFFTRKIDAMEMISQSDEVDDITKSYLGSHLGLTPGDRERRTTSPTPSSTRSSSSSSSKVLGSFVSSSLAQPQFDNTMKNIGSWNFEILTLSDEVDGFPMMYIGYCIFRHFDWFEKFQIREETLRAFLLNVESGYRKENSYHNNTHAADVTQTLFYFLTTGGLIEQRKLEPIQVFSAIIAAMLHDIDHPGRNNAFLVSTSDPLAIVYNDESVLENHHAATGFRTLKREECNILSGLSKEELGVVRKTVINLILGTDFAKHFSILATFKDTMTAVQEGADMTTDNQVLLMKVALKCADISHTTKAQHLHLAWTDRVSEEFFCQGDDEKQHGLSISPGMNREEVDICKSQVGFLTFLALPLYQEFATHNPGCEVSLKGVQRNLKYWRNRSLCEG